MVSEPYRLCPICQRKQQVRYKGYNEQHILVFMDHYVSEVETPRHLCEGSGKVFAGKSEFEPNLESESVPKTVTPVPAIPVPLRTEARATVVKQTSAQCPECGEKVLIKTNLRGNPVYVPHDLKNRRISCPGSYQRVTK